MAQVYIKEVKHFARADGDLENGITKRYFYHTDHLGSTVLVTDEQGQQVWVAEYSPFGKLAAVEGELEGNIKFTSKDLDEDTGLYYYNFRFYDPELGRFITEDNIPIDPNDPSTLNLYLYGANNPLRYIDSTGHNILEFLAGLFEYNVQKTYTQSHGGQTPSNPGYETANTVLDELQPYLEYLDDTQQQVLLGNYTDKSSLLGAIIQIGSGLAGVDLPADLRDITYDIQKFELSLNHLTQSGLDLVALVPVIGAIKNLKYGDEVTSVFKNVFNKKINQLAEQATKNKNSTEVVLGKFNKEGLSYDKVATRREATYFHLENWDEVANLIGEENMWKINKNFIDKQWKASKEFYFSHDPWKATKSFEKEVLRLIELGAKDFVKVGDNLWKVVR